MRVRKSIRATFVFLAAATVPLSAAPVIQQIMNGASYLYFNSPIAPGAVFVIKGSGLGPANISVASAPFKSTSLSGTSVAVAFGSTKVDALMYYTSDSQVAALLPSNTPVNQGAGMFTVTYNNQSSNAVGHGITLGNFGILTMNSSGQGPAIVTYPDFGLVSSVKTSSCGGPFTACGAANPGDTLSMWGTGLGPVNGDDASGAGLGQNMPNVPVTVWIGGVKASVSYKGRSGCCVGEDQIVFTVPDNVPTGCAVPLVVQIGSNTNTVSNSTVMAIAAKGSRDCTLTNPGLGSANIEQGVLAGPVTVGVVELDKFANNNSPGYFDQVKFIFAKVPSYPAGSQPFFNSWVDDRPVGTCFVYPNLNGDDGSGNYLFSNLVPLDAGSSFTVKGPAGSMTVAPDPDHSKALLSATGTFLAPGTYTITGTGGADVGPFTASITLPTPATLVSPSNANGLTVARSNGMTVNWKGGDANGRVEINVLSAADNSFNNGALASCTVAASAGTFTIPPYVLLALPPTSFTQFGFGPGTVSAAATAGFTASGLGVGFSQYFNDGVGFGGFALQ